MLGQTIMSLSILAGAIFMYYQSTQLRQIESYENVGPDFWPKLVISALIVISGYVSICNIKRQIGLKEKPEAPSESGEDWLRVAIAASIIIGYVLLLKPIGFIMASPLFIAVMMVMIRPDRKRAIPVGIIGIMSIIYILFGRLLMIPLPRGQGVFRSISIYLGL